MAKTNSFECSLPFFYGFYDSPYVDWDEICYDCENDPDWYHERLNLPKEKEIDCAWLGLRPEFYTEVCKSFCEGFKEFAPEYVKDVTYVELYQPRYYNFETDKVYARVDFADDWRDHVLKFMETNEETLRERIRKDWSSRDGFMSFMSNSYDEWVEEIKKDEPDERYVGTMLQYIMYNMYGDEIWVKLLYKVSEDVYTPMYLCYDEPDCLETENIGVG